MFRNKLLIRSVNCGYSTKSTNKKENNVTVYCCFFTKLVLNEILASARPFDNVLKLENAQRLEKENSKT